MNSLIKFCSFIARCPGFYIALMSLVLSACANQSQKPESVNQTANIASTLSSADQAIYTQAIKQLKDNPQQSLPIFLQLHQANPGDIRTRVNLANNYVVLGKISEAKLLLNSLSAGQQQNASVQNLLGLIATSEAQYGKAETFYLNAVNQANAPAESWYNLAILYDIYFQNTDKALPYYEGYLSRSTPDKKTEGWVSELKRKKSASTAK